ncbi:hypothetical protein [Streptomyces coeruleorubidus]|uniref:hypothetical protein n=1 Tax=Streptomyces coeruleorubidus TaxID=116188 RepID=UPI0033A831FF
MQRKPEILYNPRDPKVRSDPYPFLARLRETEPVHRMSFGFWVVSGYEKAALLLRDPRLTSEFHRDAKWAEHRGGWNLSVLHREPGGELVQELRQRFGGKLIVNSAFLWQTSREEAMQRIEADHADAVVVGRP